MRGSLLSLLLGLAVMAALAGCGSSKDPSESATNTEGRPPAGRGSNGAAVAAPHGISGPRRVEDSGKVGAAAVEGTLGREIEQGQPVVIGARCDRGNCVVRYRSGPRGGGLALSAQGDILRRLFARESVRSVILYVHHKSVGTPQKNEAPAFASTTCRRKEHPHFAWDRISSVDIPTVCRYTHVAGGKQRSLVRRGLLNNQEASRGKGGPSAGAKGHK
jgi:hypothetical protein